MSLSLRSSRDNSVPTDHDLSTIWLQLVWQSACMHFLQADVALSCRWNCVLETLQVAIELVQFFEENETWIAVWVVVEHVWVFVECPDLAAQLTIRKSLKILENNKLNLDLQAAITFHGVKIWLSLSTISIAILMFGNILMTLCLSASP